MYSHIHIISEATETELHPNYMNREEGISLSRFWKPLIQTLNDWMITGRPSPGTGDFLSFSGPTTPFPITYFSHHEYDYFPLSLT
jgi:hypothetical protein